MGKAAGVPVHGRAAVPKRLEDGVDGLPLLGCGKDTGDGLYSVYISILYI